MTSGDLTPGDHDQLDPASSEVQFALVIARMIDSVRDSPADMRQAIYDLARYKLQDQFTYADAKNVKQTQQALENAIRGVEEFSNRRVSLPAPPSPALVRDPGVATLAPHSPPPPSFLISQVRTRPYLEISPEPTTGAKTAQFPRPHLWRALAVIAILVGILGIVQQHERLLSLTGSLTELEGQTAPEPPRRPAQIATAPAPQPPPVKPAPLRPTDYGVYAISDDSLSELQLLPGRPPDIRIAVSAAIKVPSRTFLTNGHPKFIVFRRDVSSSISGRAEVRVIAKVAREFSAEASGKKPVDGEDTWVIRNISFPFKLAPVSDSPEMYELHSEDPGLELTPGRYALVLKSQAYDFSVEGKPVDPKQCIERIVASSGTFYTDCKMP
jgi:hypothetical protein